MTFELLKTTPSSLRTPPNHQSEHRSAFHPVRRVSRLAPHRPAKACRAAALQNRLVHLQESQVQAAQIRGNKCGLTAQIK